MSYVLLIIAIIGTFSAQIGLGHEFATSHITKRLPWLVRAGVQIGVLIAFAGAGWFIGEGADGQMRAIGTIVAVGVVGFVLSMLWYVKYPVPPRRPFRLAVYNAPLPTPAHLISFDRTEDQLLRMGQRVDRKV